MYTNDVIEIAITFRKKLCTFNQIVDKFKYYVLQLILTGFHFLIEFLYIALVTQFLVWKMVAVDRFIVDFRTYNDYPWQ